MLTVFLSMADVMVGGFGVARYKINPDSAQGTFVALFLSRRLQLVN